MWLSSLGHGIPTPVPTLTKITSHALTVFVLLEGQPWTFSSAHAYASRLASTYGLTN